MSKQISAVVCAGMTLIGIAATIIGAAAQNAEGFYKGRAIDLYIGYSVGAPTISTPG